MLVVIISLFIVLFTGFYVALSVFGKVSNSLYCAIFERKDRKLWKKLIKDCDKFKYVPSIYKTLGKHFISDCGNYEVVVWDNTSVSVIEEGLCSVRDIKSNNCILIPFDKKMSKILADKLLKRHERAFNLRKNQSVLKSIYNIGFNNGRSNLQNNLRNFKY